MRNAPREICSEQDDPRQRPNFGVKCKIFELDACQGIGKVCLVYLHKSECESDLKREDPKIWLLDRSFEWHYLAADFTQYFRMMLVHQGLPSGSSNSRPWTIIMKLVYNVILIA
ncbi:hypothetical protein ANN_21908 [Periplaneta americana]|uniref:Uncharacterized protein n=1 Tax=Periplaneta americana TaxID=6978 RepID=A0ABQ8S7I7_PERAM|nr:hypothetical protein ANN_21908 [Periplaneta americana]